MQELIRIEATPATIQANFDEVEAQLQEYLRQFDVVVSPESVGDAKRLRTELRKQIKELDTRIKDALADVSAPIREADERRKQLVQMGRDVDAKIKEQVERCEDEVRKRAGDLLAQARGKLWIEYGVSDEFCSAKYMDLVKLTTVTKGGKLTASAKKEIESRVRADKALQDRTERRLAELAGASYEAGLAAPIERQHVEHFLFDDDASYASKLRRLLDTEVDRQAKAEQRMREQQEREAAQKAEAEQREAERRQRMTTESHPGQHGDSAAMYSQPPAPAPEQQSSHVASPPVERKARLDPDDDGKETWAVTMTFIIRVPAGTSADAIKAEARKIISERAQKTLKNVLVHKTEKAA